MSLLHALKLNGKPALISISTSLLYPAVAQGVQWRPPPIRLITAKQNYTESVLEHSMISERGEESPRESPPSLKAPRSRGSPSWKAERRPVADDARCGKWLLPVPRAICTHYHEISSVLIQSRCTRSTLALIKALQSLAGALLYICTYTGSGTLA